MTTKYGMFKEHDYLRPGAPPALSKTAPATEGAGDTLQMTADTDNRDKGLNFKVTVGKTGKNATFGKFATTNVGDKYIDPLRRRLQASNEANKAIVASAPFKAVSPMKKSSGPGDYYGTSGKVEYIPGATVYTQKTRTDVKGEPKGMYTNPAKKGTFGFNKTTLSERQGYKGVATEYEYQHQPEALDIARRKAEREAHHAACASSLPFRPANPPKKGLAGIPNTTISKGKGVVGEWEYVVGRDAGGGATRKPDAPAGNPFKPVSLKPKHLGRQAEYIHDPEAPKIEAEHTRRKTEIARLAQSGPWKPGQGDKTDMTRSIIRMNI